MSSTAALRAGTVITPPHVRLVDRSLELIRGQVRRDVDDRARGGGHGDGVALRDFEVRPAVDPDAPAARFPRDWHRHMDLAAPPGSDLQKGGRVPVAERGP